MTTHCLLGFLQFGLLHLLLILRSSSDSELLMTVFWVWMLVECARRISKGDGNQVGWLIVTPDPLPRRGDLFPIWTPDCLTRLMRSLIGEERCLGRGREIKIKWRLRGEGDRSGRAPSRLDRICWAEHSPSMTTKRLALLAVILSGFTASAADHTLTPFRRSSSRTISGARGDLRRYQQGWP